MLDPMGRKEVIATVRELNEKEHVTVILITHYMEEIIHADRAFVMDKGRIAMEGTPRETLWWESRCFQGQTLHPPPPPAQ